MSDWVKTGTDILAATAKGAAAGSVVPGLGTAAGALIGLAGSLVQQFVPLSVKPALSAAATAITGVTNEADQVAAISADPAHAEAFRLEVLRIQADERAAERQADADARAADAERLAATLADVQHARDTMLALTKQSSSIAWGAPVISVVVVLAFGIVVGLVLFHPLPTGSESVVAGVVGTLGALATTVVGYWVGSSIGSSNKDARLAALEGRKAG